MVDLVNETIRDEAKRVQEAIKKEIPFDSVPNAEATVARKGFNAPLFEDGTLESQGIIINEYSSRDRGFKKYFVIEGNKDLQVKTSDGRNHKEINYADLLEIMENGGSGGKDGSVTIPPRPVVTITFNRMKASLESAIVAKAKTAIHEAIR